MDIKYKNETKFSIVRRQTEKIKPRLVLACNIGGVRGRINLCTMSETGYV